MKTMNRIFSLLTACLLLLTMLPAASLAEEAHVHDYSAITVIKNQTCDKTGIRKVTCECGASKYEIIPKHFLSDVIIQEANCGKTGLKDTVCTECLQVIEAGVEIPTTGEHSFADDISIPATCTEPEKWGSFCTVCGTQKPNTEATETGDPLGHQYAELEDKRIDPTCTEDGERTLKCDVCGDEKVETIPATGHVEISTFVPHTCTDGGKEVITCAVCKVELAVNDLSDLDPAPATGHVPGEAVRENEEAATCQEDGGYDEVVYCTICNTELSRAHTVVEAGEAHHVFDETSVVKAATCTTNGIGKTACSVCGKTKYEIIKAAHIWVDVSENTATCTEGGAVDQLCEVCGAEQTIDTEALSHDLDEGVVTTEATCGEAGEMVYTCSRCDYTETKEIPATGDHTFVESMKDETCTEPAKVGQICEVCGAEDPEHPAEVVDGSEALGHDYVIDAEDDEYIAATCTEGGVDVKVCTRCKDRIVEATEAKGHTAGGSEYLPADCENNGREVVYCADCNEIIETEDMGELDPAIGHAPKDAVRENEIAVTCQEDGSYDEVVYCDNCGEELSRESITVKSTGEEHIYGETNELKAATCTTNGIGKTACGVCGKTKYEIIKAAHTWVNVGDDTATCTEGGKVDQLCEVCGAEQTIDTEALSHDLDEGVVTTEATCGEAGEMVYTCSRCDYTETKEIPATGDHTFVESMKDETCTEPAKVGQICEVCGAEDPEHPAEVVDGSEALGHDYVIDAEDDEYIAATCTEGGVDVKVCTRCKDRIVEATEAKGHTAGESKYEPADCENNGRMIIRCADCEEIIETEDLGELDPATGHDLEETIVEATCKEGGYKLITCKHDGCEYEETMDETEPNPDNHIYGDPIVLKAATCTTNGIAKSTCAACGKTKYETIKAEHTVDEYIVETPATCTEPGSMIGVCSRCGEEIEKAIPATGHDYVEVSDDQGTVYKVCLNCGDEIHCEHKNTETLPAVEATCTESGLTEGVKCTDCGETLKAQEEIPVLGHIEETVPAVDATCIESGLTEGVECVVCGETLKAQEEIPALGHTEEIVPAVDATCAEAGHTEGVKCSVCGETLSGMEETPALEHTVEVITGKAATCTESGLTDGEKCSVCNEILKAQEEIPTLGHTVETITGKAATCTESGLTDGEKCSVCGETLKAQETIPATGHKSEKLAGKAATCTESGLTDGEKCSVCGETLKAQETIPAKGHSYKVSYSFNDSFTKKIATYTCSGCGHTYTEELDY